MHGTTYELRRSRYIALIRSDIGATLRDDRPHATKPPGASEGVGTPARERRLAAVDACIAEVVRAAVRDPRTLRSAGE